MMSEFDQEKAKIASLNQEFRLKDVVLRNRIAVSPMWVIPAQQDFGIGRHMARAARFLPLRVWLDFTLPPVFFQLGHKPSQLLKCLTVGHLLMSVPNSLMSVNAWISSMPSMAVKSTPVA
jgi:hypothetical protein